MTLGQLVESLQFKSGFNDSAYRPRWVSFINEAIREFSRVQPWPGLEDTATLTTDGTKYLILPNYVDSIVHLLNRTDNIPIETGTDYAREVTALYAQGTAGKVFSYDKIGEVATTHDPAGYLYFVSTHPSDLQQVYITGLAANSGASGGLERTYKELSVAATGTSPVTLSALFTKVISVSKATDSNGDFYFYDAGASLSHIAFLAKTDSESRFKRLQLLFVPSAGTVLELRFRYRIPPLRQDAQSPHPSVRADFVIHHALSLHWQEQEQLQKSQLAEQNAKATLEKEVNKDTNFDEPNSYIVPVRTDDPDDVYWYQAWWG